MTDQGALIVTPAGPTSSDFTATFPAPEPASILLGAACR